MLAIGHLQLREGGRAGFPPKQVMFFWVLCSWGGGVILFDFIFVLCCYMVKKCQLEKMQKRFSLTRGTLHCFSVLFTTDGDIGRVFPR